MTDDQPQKQDAQDTSQKDRTEESDDSVTGQVQQPAKVMRLATMIQRLLEEERAAPLDEQSRRRLADVHATSVTELKDGLSPELADELQRLTRPFSAEHTPSNDELRIAQAQLVGWLEGLFQGIQTALVAQQMASRAQVERGRHELPQRPDALPGRPIQGPQQPGQGGMYL